MGEAADVRSIQALDDLKAVLSRFGGEVQEALSGAAQEIQRTQEWLTERYNYWRKEVARRAQIVLQAQAALARCEAAAAAGGRSGAAAGMVACAPLAAALQIAEARLREAEAELRTVQQWMRRVQQATDLYQRQAQRLVALLSNDLPKASALLGRSAATLNAYAAMNLSTGITHSTGESAASIPSTSERHYESLDNNTDAKYDKATDRILINEKYRNVQEPALLEPLQAHEAVHAKYKSDDPYDEASLQKYTDEEVEAYKAQLNAWLKVEADFDLRYPTPSSREALGEGRNLLSSHRQLKQQVEEEGWEGVRKAAENKYRERLRGD